MKNINCFLAVAILTALFCQEGNAQKSIKSSITYAPVLSFINQYDDRNNFGHLRSDLYDYTSVSRGFKLGYTAGINLSKRLTLKLSVDIQEEQYRLTEKLYDTSGTYGKFVITNRYTLLHPSLGISYTIPSLDSVRFFIGYGYKHLFFLGGGVGVYENIRGNFSGFVASQSSSEPLRWYGCVTLGLSKPTKSKRFEYGISYQIALSPYPRINYRNQVGSTISEGWSSPKVNCLLFQLNYNFGKRLY